MSGDNLGTLTVDLIANTGGFEKGMDRAQRSLKSATKEAAYQATQLDKLVGQIDPVVAAYGKLDKMEEQLRKHRAAGRLDETDFSEYLSKLDAQRASLAQVDTVLQKGGMSAKAYAAALRTVPSQFTDIATSLQAGQNPLSVFLQQGGQLKDSFGGAGPAAKALGGYVLGLVNPFTVAAAAAGVLAFAYKQGSDEASAYQKSLVLTGNASGATVNGLENLAQTVSKTTGTVGAASAVLVQLASTGKIPVASFDSIAVAALKMEAATGKATADTVAEFAKLADDPVKASKALNDQLHYLNAAVYEQIDAMQRSGDQQGAATLAEQAYAQALSTRADSIKANLGSVESGWQSVKNAAKGAWDAILDVGREKTFEEKMKLLQEQLDNSARLGTGSRGGGGRGTEQIQSDITGLGVTQNEKTTRAAALALYQDIQDKGVKALENFNKGLDDTASKSEKMAKELKAAQREIDAINRAAKVNGTTGVSDSDAAKRLAGIRDKYKDSAKATKAYTENASTKALDDARKQYAVLQQQSQLIGTQGAGTQQLGENAKKLIEWEQQLADIKTKKTLTADQKSLLAGADLYTAQLKRNAALETENTLKQRSLDQAKKLAAFETNLQAQLAGAQQGLSNSLAGTGMGDQAKQRLQEQLSIQQSYQAQQDKLTSDYNKSNKDQLSTELYDKETAALSGALSQRLAMQQKYYTDVDAAQSDWANGFNAANQNYVTSAKDVAGQTQSAFTSLYGGLTDAAADWVTGTDTSFKSVALSFGKMLVKMELQAAASSVFSSLSGGGLSSLFTSSAATSVGSTAAGYSGSYLSGWSGATYSDGGYTGDGGKYQPMGVVHGGEFVVQKSVVQQPGMRNMLQHLNQTGRGYADGGYVGLGAAAASTPASGGNAVSFSLNIAAGDNSSATTADPSAIEEWGRLEQKRLDASWKQFEARSLSPGGNIRKAINGRA